MVQAIPATVHVQALHPSPASICCPTAIRLPCQVQPVLPASSIVAPPVPPVLIAPPAPASGSQVGMGQPQRLGLGCEAGTQGCGPMHSVTMHELVPLMPPLAPLTPPATTPPAPIVMPPTPPATGPLVVPPAPAVPRPGFNPVPLHPAANQTAAKMARPHKDILHIGIFRAPHETAICVPDPALVHSLLPPPARMADSIAAFRSSSTNGFCRKRVEPSPPTRRRTDCSL